MMVNLGGNAASNRRAYAQRRTVMFSRIFVPLLTTLFLAGVIGTLSGCNTMEGVGKDIEQGGKAIKDEAKEQKRY
jgi:predicted small secreted protein